MNEKGKKTMSENCSNCIHWQEIGFQYRFDKLQSGKCKKIAGVVLPENEFSDYIVTYDIFCCVMHSPKKG